MSLPKVYKPMEPVEIGGATFEIRSLTRAEHYRLQKMVVADAPADELEIAVIGWGTDTAPEEVREWYGAAPDFAAKELVEAIQRISKLTEGAQKSSGEGDSPRG